MGGSSVRNARAGQLEKLQVPTQIIWGAGDGFLDARWARWLRGTIPGATELHELPGTKLFFPDERVSQLVDLMRAHWGGYRPPSPVAREPSVRVLRFVSVVCAALVFGLTMSHVLQSPGSRGLPPAAWLDVQHTFYGGFAIVGGSTEIVGFVSSLLLAVLVWRSGRHASLRARAWGAPAVAAVALLGTLLAYWFGNRPVNAKVAVWTVATIPDDWSSYRAVWENAHALSAILSGVAFLALLVPLVWPNNAGTDAREPDSS